MCFLTQHRLKNGNVHFLQSLGHDDTARQVFYCLAWSLHTKRLDLNDKQKNRCWALGVG